MPELGKSFQVGRGPTSEDLGLIWMKAHASGRLHDWMNAGRKGRRSHTENPRESRHPPNASFGVRFSWLKSLFQGWSWANPSTSRHHFHHFENRDNRIHAVSHRWSSQFLSTYPMYTSCRCTYREYNSQLCMHEGLQACYSLPLGSPKKSLLLPCNFPNGSLFHCPS